MKNKWAPATFFNIDVEYGSDWQKKTGDERMRLMLEAFKSFTEGLHKGNKVMIDSHSTAMTYEDRRIIRKKLNGEKISITCLPQSTSA